MFFFILGKIAHVQVNSAMLRCYWTGQLKILLNSLNVSPMAITTTTAIIEEGPGPYLPPSAAPVSTTFPSFRINRKKYSPARAVMHLSLLGYTRDSTFPPIMMLLAAAFCGSWAFPSAVKQDEKGPRACSGSMFIRWRISVKQASLTHIS